MAASATKQAYDDTMTHRNAENVNGKIIHATSSNATDTFDWRKREAIEQQRKLRLTQVSVVQRCSMPNIDNILFLFGWHRLIGSRTIEGDCFAGTEKG